MIRTNHVDFDSNESLQQTLDRIERHRGRIDSFRAHGPGGGNPCIALTFDDKRDALAFLREQFPKGESEALLESLLTTTDF